MRTVRILAYAFVICSAAILGACKRKQPRPSQESASAGGTASQPTDTTKARADTSGAAVAARGGTKSCCGGGMPCTSGMAGVGCGYGMTSAAMLDSMEAHMRRAGHMSAEQMTAMIPMHRQMVDNMLSQMESESQAKNLPASPAWNALADSVRQDLARLPETNKNDVKQAMPADCARVTRLIRMHQAMMSAPVR